MTGQTTLRKRILLFSVLLTLLSCAGTPEKRFFDTIAQNPSKNLRSYKFNSAAPLIGRVKPAPEFLLNALRRMDHVDGYSSYIPTPKELALIDRYLMLLPKSHQELLKSRLISIYFVNNFMGSGLTDYVLDEKGDLFAIMVFNPDALKTDISAWMTIRENSCFIKDDPSVRIKVNCGTQYQGFLYALLHESAHLVDYVDHRTPYVEQDMKYVAKSAIPSSTALTHGVWMDYSTPAPQFDFERRKDIVFYGLQGGPRIKISEAHRMYQRLEETPFSSLYGSQNWAEDFAELFTWHYFTKTLSQPYEIDFFHGQDRTLQLKPMTFPHVVERNEILKQWY